MSFFGFPLTPWTSAARNSASQAANSETSSTSNNSSKNYILIMSNKTPGLKKLLAEAGLPEWLMETAQASPDALNFTQLEDLNVFTAVLAKHPGDNFLAENTTAKARDLAAQVVCQCLTNKISAQHIDLYCEADEMLTSGVSLGVELGSYQFKPYFFGKEAPLPTITANFDLCPAAANTGAATNLAKHLVNVPANFLTPESYCREVESFFSNQNNFEVEVYDFERLLKENAGLIAAVGQGRDKGAYIVHMKYRSPAAKDSTPVALVGKGITFDSGGLDMKSAAGMRLMKKDMGGSASVCGLGLWLALEQPAINCDLYLAIAENSVSDRAFRPGDILTARSGKTVEIHNTDAEGRLVLADAIDLALNQKDKPKVLIDMATLTGAMRVALGPKIGGMMTNSPALADKITSLGLETGDPMWQMPLFKDYRSYLASDVADISNAARIGFGGGITAGLFLSEFVKDTDWVHLDIYCWTDSPYGSITTTGGTGQAVQCISSYLKSLV